MQKIIWLGMVVLSLVGVNVQAKDNTYVGDNIINPALKSSGYCYFDWYRPSNMKKDKQELLNNGMIKLQARFQWQGKDKGNVPLTEHSVLALTQKQLNNYTQHCGYTNTNEELKNSIAQPERQWLHKYGAGVILSPLGLGLELWNGDQTAWVWDQTNDRCVSKAPIEKLKIMCIGNKEEDISYITEAPHFKLKRGKYYWLRVTYKGEVKDGVNWVKMTGEVLEENMFGLNLIQKGSIGFILNQYFNTFEPLETSVAKTAPNGNEDFYNPEDLKYWLFDYGF